MAERDGAGPAEAAAETNDNRLAEYRARRDFQRTPEPRGQQTQAIDGRFVVQKHAARRLHYDLRLAMGGTFRSWAVAKGPSVDPADKRLAVQVEDHPLEYGDFEGVIPEGEYGSGTVMLWDRGRWEPATSSGRRQAEDPEEAYHTGRLKLRLDGERLKGGWALVRMGGKKGRDGRTWLLIKEMDDKARPGEADAFLAETDTSVRTGRSLDEIAGDRDRVWQPGRGEVDPAQGAPGRHPDAADMPDPGALDKAKPARMPGFVPPQLAHSSTTPPRGEDWLHEIKLDGYRLQCRIDHGEARILTRSGKDWTGRFPELARAAAALPVGEAVIDGEVTANEEAGMPSFAALQQALSGERPAPMPYYAFDLLHLNGFDLRDAALSDRKAALLGLLEAAGRPAPFLYSEHFEAGGERVLEHACRFALEGIVSKKRGAPYRSGRQRTWRKAKCIERQEFVVAGYARSSTGSKGIGSLVVGYHDADGRLTYAGRVGTGFTDKAGRELREALDERGVDDHPFEVVPKRLPRELVWARPELVAEVEFRTWTEDGLLRQASFKGLREDKPATEVTLEAPGRAGPGVEPTTVLQGARGLVKVSGVSLSHADRVLYPRQGLTKLGLAEYWNGVATLALPEIAGRPLSLVRCPSGHETECFYQKHAMEGLDAAVRRLAIREAEGRKKYMAVDDAAGLVALVQMGTLEIHTWGSRADDIERPDRLVLDLDPDDAVPWDQVTGAALELRDRLGDLGLASFCKTTGGKGLHVVVPIRRERRWEPVKAFCQALAAAMAADSPKRYLTTSGKAARRGKIYIDHLRNARGATAVAPYSPRARAGAPVATPVAWDELPSLQSARQYSVATVGRRLSAMRVDPWAEIRTVQQGLTDKALSAMGLD